MVGTKDKKVNAKQISENSLVLADRFVGKVVIGLNFIMLIISNEGDKK